MSFGLKNCLQLKSAAGEVDATRAKEVLDLFADLEKEARFTMGEAQARQWAAKETARIVRDQNGRAKTLKLMQVVTAERINGELTGFKDLKGQPDLPRAATAMFDPDAQAKGVSSLPGVYKSIRGRIHNRMNGVMQKFSNNLLGQVRNRALLNNMVRELFGTETGDIAAKELAQAWRDGSEFARLEFNARGGNISKKAGWGMPQNHETLSVRKAGEKKWLDFILPRLDRSKMFDLRTGLPITETALTPALKDVYQTIVTEGWTKITPSGAARGKSLANRRLDHRWLTFKDGDAWLEYNTQFGTRDPYSTMMSHVDHMSRDIAALDMFGPNPEATIRWMGEKLTKDAQLKDAKVGGDKNLNKAKSSMNTIEGMWAAYKGTTMSPVDSRLALNFQTGRSLLVAAQLPGAMLSALSDIGFSGLTASYNGLKATTVMRNLLKIMADPEFKNQAIRSGLIADSLSGHMTAAHRYMGEVAGHEMARRMSNGFMRASGLEAWTQNMKWAFGMEFTGSMADWRGLEFSALNKDIQKTLTRYGLDGGNWDKIRSSTPDTFKGSEFMGVEDIASNKKLDPGEADLLATKYLEMIQTETGFAVPEQTLRSQALVDRAQRGTWIGELVRTGFMYKSFPISVFFTHVMRGLGKGSDGFDGKYLTGLIASTALFGALALQLKEISKGRDPRSMNTKEFWAAAALQGGGLGIFGDLLFADQNRFGGGFAQSLAGPGVALAEDLLKLSIGNLQEVATGKETNIGAELISFMKRYHPGSALWYTRLAIERGIFDRLQELNNPVYAKRKQRRRIRTAQKDYGQQYWWKPGSGLPDRAPNLLAALEK